MQLELELSEKTLFMSQFENYKICVITNDTNMNLGNIMFRSIADYNSSSGKYHIDNVRNVFRGLSMHYVIFADDIPNYIRRVAYEAYMPCVMSLSHVSEQHKKYPKFGAYTAKEFEEEFRKTWRSVGITPDVARIKKFLDKNSEPFFTIEDDKEEETY
jgi:hypothetical protein